MKHASQPQIIPIEQAILGYMIDPDFGGPSAVIYALAMGITPEDFYYSEHRYLFEALVKLTEQQIPFHKEADLSNPYPAIRYMFSKIHPNRYEIPKEYLAQLRLQFVATDTFIEHLKLLKQSATDRKLKEQLIKALHHYEKTGSWDGILANITQIIFNVTASQTAPSPIKFSELKDIPITAEFIWEPLLRADGITLLVGPAGVGKSLLALYIALQIAIGNELFSFKTTPTTILYCDAETNERIFKERINRFAPNPPDNVYYINLTGNLMDIQTYAQFVYVLKTVQPGLVILDSLIRYHNLDENKSSDMRLLATFFKSLVEKFNCAFLLLHHTRKTTPYGTTSDVVRGSTELRAFPDTILILKRIKGSTEMVIDIDKCRDSHQYNQTRFKIRLNTTELWTYEFLGFTEEVESRLEDAIRLILSLLEEAPKSRQELLEHLKAHGIKRTTADYAIRELKETGKIIKVTQNRKAIYQLSPSTPTEKQQPLALEDNPF